MDFLQRAPESSLRARTPSDQGEVLSSDASIRAPRSRSEPGVRRARVLFSVLRTADSQSRRTDWIWHPVPAFDGLSSGLRRKTRRLNFGDARLNASYNPRMSRLLSPAIHWQSNCSAEETIC